MIPNIKIVLVCIACGFLCALVLIVCEVFPVSTNTVDEIPVVMGITMAGTDFSDMQLQGGVYQTEGITPCELQFDRHLKHAWLYLDIENCAVLTANPIPENSDLWDKVIPQQEDLVNRYNLEVLVGESRQKAAEFVLNIAWIRCIHAKYVKGATDEN